MVGAAAAMRLTTTLAAAFARTGLDNINREYPHKVDHVLAAAATLPAPRGMHPVFFGSYDWHSCVHIHWLLVRLLRLQPELTEAVAIVQVMDQRFTEENVAAEVAYFQDPAQRTFERPYGWSWLLKLQTELRLLGRQDNAWAHWAERMQPLADVIESRYLSFLPRADFPVRAGTHGNSAFGLLFPLNYARVADRPALESIICERALGWFEQDHDYPARYEPSGEDFLSGGLMEAALMARLPRFDFGAWWQGFCPAKTELRSWLEPVSVSDPSDPRLAHLDGLNLSRAWCWNILGASLPPDALAAALAAASAHLNASLSQTTKGDYAGTHWLASFALLALTEH